MITLQLHNLEFHAYHGLYEQENFTGNTFEIDADVVVDVEDQITKLNQTVNYATVYNIIKKRMQQPTPLLETVAQELTLVIHDIDSRIRSVSITIKKLSPPIENFQGTVGVSYKKEF
ncbi:MAG: dihydroneopterin aldolase [Ferruginibacter sp.]